MRQEIVFAFAALLAPFVPAASAQCKPVDLKSFSMCFPEKWRIERGTAPGTGSGCNRLTGPCTANSGLPLPGVILLSFKPFEGPADLSAAITKVDPHVSSKESPAELASGALTGQMEYVVSRTLLPGKIWNDVYAIQTGGKIVICEARYRDETAKVETYRQAIFGILTSVSVRN